VLAGVRINIFIDVGEINPKKVPCNNPLHMHGPGLASIIKREIEDEGEL
jgi:hypothetical protein